MALKLSPQCCCPPCSGCATPFVNAFPPAFSRYPETAIVHLGAYNLVPKAGVPDCGQCSQASGDFVLRLQSGTPTEMKWNFITEPPHKYYFAGPTDCARPIAPHIGLRVAGQTFNGCDCFTVQIAAPAPRLRAFVMPDGSTLAIECIIPTAGNAATPTLIIPYAVQTFHTNCGDKPAAVLPDSVMIHAPETQISVGLDEPCSVICRRLESDIFVEFQDWKTTPIASPGLVTQPFW